MMTLWILSCRMSKNIDTLFPFYARDREHAEEQAEKILKEHPYERLELKEYLGGFKILRTELPGRIDVEG